MSWQDLYNRAQDLLCQLPPSFQKEIGVEEIPDLNAGGSDLLHKGRLLDRLSASELEALARAAQGKLAEIEAAK